MTPTTPPWAAPFTVTLSPHQLSLGLTVLGLLVIAGLVAGFLRWTKTRKAAERDWTLSALDSFALLLSPVWIALLFGVLYALWRVFDAFDPGLAGSSLRWHVLAFVGLITALGALVTAPLALIRVYTTERQTRVTEQGHMTDRISKAVEQLGAEKTIKRPGPVVDGKATTVEETVPSIEVRIGGIYALERIAQDSMTTDKGRDHIRVMELLCAYIRENAPARGVQDHPFAPLQPFKRDATNEERAAHLLRRRERLGSGKVQGWARRLPPPRTDIQTALTVIGRRKPEQIALERATATPGTDEGYRLDLRNTCVRRADLSCLSFKKVQFTDSRMEGALLSQARMEGADLVNANMEGVILRGAQMEGADLSVTQMEGADLSEAQMEGANLSMAEIEGADLSRVNLTRADVFLLLLTGSSLRSANFTGATGLAQSLFNEAWGDNSTILPEGIRRPYHWDSETLADVLVGDPRYDAWLAAGAPPGKPSP